jgi:hypothetical protein
MLAALGLWFETNGRLEEGRGAICVWSGVCDSRVQSVYRDWSVTIGDREERQMISTEVKSVWAVLASAALAVGSALAAETGTPTQAAPISQSELKALVAPIALYPDNLVAVVLAAATFPDQVAIADYWLEQHKSLTGNALMQAVNTQSWNASVKALTQFPSVLGNMAKSLSWTSQLGEAYHSQKTEVMTAIQALRAQAKAAGNLKSTPQITVEQQTPQTIIIQPANPQVVYVPEYNPAVIYGYPYVTPGYTAGQVAAASALSFGAGIAVGALMGGGCCGWGWDAWGCNWAGGAVLYNHSAFYGNAAWHGGYAGGYHPYARDGGYHPYGDDAFNRNDFNRNVSGNTVNVNRASAFSDNHFADANSWAQHDNLAGRSNAFSGLSSRSGGFGGWSSRADSARGWGSMRAGGFGGFQSFGGFHGGGLGGFHGGFGGRR